jgi:hypothetical protein
MYDALSMGDRMQIVENLKRWVFSGEAKVALDKVKQRGGDVCGVALEQMREDPKVDAALKEVAKEDLIYAAKLRIPVVGPMIMGKHVADQAYTKYKQGHMGAAIATYAASAVVGATGVIPLIPGVNFAFGLLPLGDLAIEGFRAAGLEIDRSPIHKAYNTVMGTRFACNKLDAHARVKLNIGHGTKALAIDKEFALHAQMPRGQEEAVNDLLKHTMQTYQRMQKETGEKTEIVSPVLPVWKPSTRALVAKH